MKKLMFGCALLATALQGSLTAGYHQESSFEGLYFGGNLGVVSHTANRNDLDDFLTFLIGVGPEITTTETDFTAGLQLGYDWHCNGVLFGGVFDWNWSNIDHQKRFDSTGLLGPAPLTLKTEMDWFSTIRARAGLTVCRGLLYMTAGAAFARFDTTWSTNVVNAGRVTASFGETRCGWAGGLGMEYLLGCNWSLGGEVLGMHFGRDRVSATVLGAKFNFEESDTVWVGRLLLNYRFGDLCCLWR